MSTYLVTREKNFSPVGPALENATIFKVAEGVDAKHALEKASALLEVIVGSIEDAAVGARTFEGKQA